MYKISKILVNELNKNNVKYCHWKSNVNLKKSLKGYDDLDLLIDKNDYHIFNKILLKYNFKEAYNEFLNINSIRHFYGFDSETGSILHLHVYTKIITGPSWIKSYFFDLNKVFFNVRYEYNVALPPKEIELILFVFRIYLKYSSFFEFFSTFYQKKLIKEEIEYLTKNISDSKLENLLNKYFPNITFNEFTRYKNELIKRNFLNTIYNSFKLRSQLKHLKIHSSFDQIFKSLNHFRYRLINKLFFKRKKRLTNGGSFIVITGLDASGKSSMIKIIKDWLSPYFDVNDIHFGKPASSLITFPINLFISFYKLLFKKNQKSNSNNDKKSLFYIVRQLCLAYDRFNLIKSNIRKSYKGEIIICDRYKSENINVMDSKRLSPNNFTSIKKSIAKIENSLYDKLIKPDLLINLTVPVDVAVDRNYKRNKINKENEDGIRERHLLNKNLEYKANLFKKIDTNKNYNEIILEVKSIIWKII